MPIHDFICDKCGARQFNIRLVNRWTYPCDCGGEFVILWTTEASKQAQVHPAERAVVWMHPSTGEVRYPGRNDVPMPERYRAAGFERHEFPSLHSLQTFSKERGVINEKVEFDQGSGNGI